MAFWCPALASGGGASPHVRHETTAVHHASRRRGSVAVCGARAAAGDAGGWLPLHRPAIQRRRVSCAVVCRGLNHTGFVEGQNGALCGYWVRGKQGGKCVG